MSVSFKKCPFLSKNARPYQILSTIKMPGTRRMTECGGIFGEMKTKTD